MKQRDVYMVRKLMVTAKPMEESQRHKLFQTRWVILGKVFDLIIDSGSQENIICKEVVKKLQLPVEKHPTPYPVGWIKTIAKRYIEYLFQ